jgi:hypothetical protein
MQPLPLSGLIVHKVITPDMMRRGGPRWGGYALAYRAPLRRCLSVPLYYAGGTRRGRFGPSMGVKRITWVGRSRVHLDRSAYNPRNTRGGCDGPQLK